MDFETFIEGPLLWVVFSILVIALVFRFFFFLFSLFKSKKNKTEKTNLNWKFVLSSLGRILFPLHKAIIRKPVYTILRYLFHLCLFLVPIGLFGHITMWEASSLELSWPALPDALADRMTVIFIVLSVLFLLRRIVLPEIRRRSSAFDYMFIVVCLLPFLSGYFLAHGTLDSIPFFLKHMLSIHILSSCLMILTAAFLFLGSRLDSKNCTGCAACELNCPTGTLEYNDKGNRRLFYYSHYQCISCGACIDTCPEDAAELRHETGLIHFFRVLKKPEIRVVELDGCRRCGALFAPVPQVEKLTAAISEEYIHFCERCKKTNAADTFRRMLPRSKK
jgi:NAD-dependent dihydropyrimidine dehydrogenase PreA subunit/nitrate reductase gamma subunit